MGKYIASIFVGMVIFSVQLWAQRIDIVIDIDDTLVQNIRENRIGHGVHKNRVMKVDEHFYIFFDGADEFIKYLLGNKDVVITFFSTGAKERNEKMIVRLISEMFDQDQSKEIRGRINVLSSDRTVYAGNNEDLQPLGHRFNGNWKKDLREVGGNLNWTALIDDDASYAIRGQERNLLKVKGIGSSLSERQYYDKETVRSRNHFMFALGLLLTSLQNAERNGTTLVDELHAIQYDDSEEDGYGCYSYYEKANQEIFYQIGLNAMKEVNPGIELFLPGKQLPWND